MSTLIESLERQIKRLEAMHGSDELYVIFLKEQLRACKANAGKSTQQALNFQSSAEISKAADQQELQHKSNEEWLLKSLDDINPQDPPTEENENQPVNEIHKINCFTWVLNLSLRKDGADGKVEK